MSVVIETTLGDITVDLYLEQRPVTCLNFLKLCKMKYYNYNLFHTIRSDFIAQTGDPTGEGTGGESIWGILEGPQKRFFSGEKMPKIRHTGAGLLSMVCTDEMMVGSQFFFTLAPDLNSLDGVHCVIGEVTEGQEVLTKLNEVICDETNRPYRDVRITHTVILEDPFNDPPGLRAPSRSPSPNPERLKGGRIAPDEEIDEAQGKSIEEVQEMIEEKEAKARATILEIVGDLPDADIAPPENVLFVCKLNPVTTDDDLEIIFSRFGKIVSCEVIRDKKTGNSLQYAFIEFENKKSCEDAYFKMDNVLIDDRRIHVDFSQSVSKMRYLGKGRGVQYLNDEVITNPEIKKRSERGDISRQSHSDKRKYNKEERDGTAKRHNNDKKCYEHEKDDKSGRLRRYDRERDDESRNRRNERRQYEIKEDDRSRKHHRDKEREDLLTKRYNDKERDDLSRKNHHDQRQHRERSESREDNNQRYHKDKKSKNLHKSPSRNYSRNHSTDRLPKNGDRRDRHIELEKYDGSHKLTTKKREMSSSPKIHRNERSPRRQKESGSHEVTKDGKKSHDVLEKNHKSSEKNSSKKLKKNEHVSKDRNENSKKTKHKDSRTPSPVDNKKKEKSSKKIYKSKTNSSKKNSFRRKHKKSTSSDSDSESSSSSSDSSLSSDSDKKKSKARRRKRKYSSSSSSESSSSNSSSSDSSSDSSSSSSDSEPKKKRVKKNKNKSCKGSKK